MKAAAAKVQAVLDALGLDRKVITLAVDARTSQQAAEALGVAVGQIAKSLVFTVNGRPVLVIASGANRVDERRLGELAGGQVRRADPETVRQVTGYAIGGVPPLGHGSALPVYLDRTLFAYQLVFAAAGVPDGVFPIAPDELLRATGGLVCDLARTGDERSQG